MWANDSKKRLSTTRRVCLDGGRPELVAGPCFCLGPGLEQSSEKDRSVRPAQEAATTLPSGIALDASRSAGEQPIGCLFTADRFRGGVVVL